MLKLAILFFLATAQTPTPIPGALLVGEKTYKNEAACKKDVEKFGNEAGQKLQQALAPMGVRVVGAKATCAPVKEIEELQAKVKKQAEKPKGEKID